MRPVRKRVANLADLSDEALWCHAFGHPWEARPVSRLSPVGREVWVVTLHCTSCTKTRTDYVTPGTFELEERQYSDPPGFAVVGEYSRTDYRQEWIHRQQLKATTRGQK